MSIALLVGMITITKTSKGWMADMSQAADAEEVKALFGTYIIQTAFTAHADVERVKQALAKLNPGVTIVVR